MKGIARLVLGSFPEVSSQNTVSQRIFPSRKFPRRTVSQKACFPVGSFPEGQFPRRTVSQSDTFPEVLFPRRQFPRRMFSQKVKINSGKTFFWGNTLKKLPYWRENKCFFPQFPLNFLMLFFKWMNEWRVFNFCCARLLIFISQL